MDMNQHEQQQTSNEHQRPNFGVLIWHTDDEGVKFCPLEEALKQTGGKSIDQSVLMNKNSLIARTPTMLWNDELARNILALGNPQYILILHRSIASDVLSNENNDPEYLKNRLDQSGAGIIIAPLPRYLNEKSRINHKNLTDCENSTCIGNVPDVRVIFGKTSSIAYWLKMRIPALEKAPGQDLIVFWSENSILSKVKETTPSHRVDVDLFGSTLSLPPPTTDTTDQAAKKILGSERLTSKSNNNGSKSSPNEMMKRCQTCVNQWCKKNMTLLIIFLVIVVIVVVIVIVAVSANAISKKRGNHDETKMMRRNKNNPINNVYYNYQTGQLEQGPLMSTDQL